MTEENKKQNEENADAPRVESEIERLKRECEEYLNGWKRAKADLINYKKDEEKRFEEVMKYGFLDLVRDFIPVLDSFDFAISVLEKERLSAQAPPELPQSESSRDKGLMKGVYMIRTQLEDVLKKRGLERMMISMGAPFDPALHESVGEVESEYPAGAIAEEIERGYFLNGRVVRPARVKLAKQKTYNL